MPLGLVWENNMDPQQWPHVRIKDQIQQITAGQFSSRLLKRIAFQICELQGRLKGTPGVVYYLKWIKPTIPNLLLLLSLKYVPNTLDLVWTLNMTCCSDNFNFELNWGIKSFGLLYWAHSILWDRKWASSLFKIQIIFKMAVMSSLPLCKYWYYLILSSNIHVKWYKRKRGNSPIRLPLEGRHSLTVSQFAAAYRENWKS